MAETRTISETFPKSDGWTSEEIDEQRRQRLAAGALSSVKTEDEENFYLNSVYQVAGTGTSTTAANPGQTEGSGEPTEGARDGDSGQTEGASGGDSEPTYGATGGDPEPSGGAGGS